MFFEIRVDSEALVVTVLPSLWQIYKRLNKGQARYDEVTSML